MEIEKRKDKLEKAGIYCFHKPQITEFFPILLPNPITIDDIAEYSKREFNNPKIFFNRDLLKDFSIDFTPLPVYRSFKSYKVFAVKAIHLFDSQNPFSLLSANEAVERFKKIGECVEDKVDLDEYEIYLYNIVEIFHPIKSGFNWIYTAKCAFVEKGE